MSEFQVVLVLLITSVLSLDVYKQEIFEEIPNNDELTAWNEDLPQNGHQLPSKDIMNGKVLSVLVPVDERHQYTGYSLPGIATYPYSGNQFSRRGNAISLQPPATNQAYFTQLFNSGLPLTIGPYKGVQVNHDGLPSSGVKVALVDQALPIGQTTRVNKVGSLGHGGQASPVFHTSHDRTNVAESVSALSAPIVQFGQVGNVNTIYVPFRCQSTFWNTKDCNTCYCNSGHPVCIPILCEKQSCPMKWECANFKGFCVKSGTICHGRVEPSLCGGNACTCCIPEAGKFAIP